MELLSKLIKFAKDAWIILGITLLMLMAIEATISLAFYLRSFWHSPAPDYRIEADPTAEASWAPQYFKEIEGLELPSWKPYVYWRRKPHQGNGINIGPDGLRKTYTDGASGMSGSAVKVFMFGGSTMWGEGVRDDFTIPSLFAKEVKSKGILCKVTNLSQTGYVSTQEVIELLLQLQSGNVPDMVIFYDGVNDTFSAFQEGEAGLTQNEFNREVEFNLLQKKELRSLAVQNGIKQLSTIRFINGILGGFGGRLSGSPHMPLKYTKSVSDKRALARSVVEKYINNITLVRALSKSYGFKCLFYWQPVIYQKQQLTDYERRAIEIEHNYAGMKEFYGETYAFLQKRVEGSKRDFAFHDLSSMFNQVHESIYIDYCHIGEKGNGMVAQIMAEDFARSMKTSGKSAELMASQDR